jgi:hypothetical protein
MTIAPPSPWTLTYKLLGTLAGIVLVLWGAWTLLNLAARDTFETHKAYAEVKSLRVSGAGGDVTLVSAPAGAGVTVTEHVTRGLTEPERTNQLVAGQLRLSSDCPDFPGGSCSVRYEVTVPRGVPVVAESGAGDVRAEGLTTNKPVDLSSGAGDVVVTDVSAPRLRLHSSAGDVIGTGIGTGDVRATSAAGDVRLELVGPAPQSVFADSSAGDVSLAVPDVTYAVQASTSAGDVTSDAVRNDPDSPRKLTATSSAGDVNIDVTR